MCYLEKLFDKYKLQLHNYSNESKNDDAKFIAEIIFAKYGGEDMIEILIQVFKLIHKRNHFLTKNITIDNHD